jgi:hypothetical protein
MPLPFPSPVSVSSPGEPTMLSIEFATITSPAASPPEAVSAPRSIVTGAES